MAEKNVKFYKTKDGTIVYCKDEFARQQIEQLQGIWEAIEELPDGQAVSAQVAIHTTEIAALQNGKANINGSYDSMTVGMAKNVEATSEISGTSLYRPTAGNADVADGVARVLKIGGNAINWNQLYDSAVPTAVTNHKYFCKEYNSGVERNEIILAANLVSWFTDGSANRNVIDLTLMFGAGNEPSSVAAFEAWLQANVGLRPYYAYNSGELLSAKMLGMKTVGFNQWDEEWESGFISSIGSLNYDAHSIRSKNVCRCIPNTQYYCRKPHSYPYYIDVCWYDANLEFIGRVEAGSLHIVTSPANAAYFKISCYGYGTTYNHDICINLHYTNGRDGEYEPYVEHQYNFDTSKVYGKLGGEGELVQTFPNGLKSAGSARDELTIKGGAAKVIKRVGSKIFDNNDTWGKAYDGLFYSGINTAMKSLSNNINNKYIAGTPGDTTAANIGTDKTLRCGTDKRCVLKDTSCADVEAVKTAMNGVMLYYELAEPAEYTDLVYRDNGVDVPLLDYFSGVILVDNYGTEEQLLESPTDNNPNSCAAGMDIVYGVNAADFIDAANNGSFISEPSQDALLSTLSAALGGTLSATWNATTGHYDYTFTPATRQIENPENNE